MNGHLSLNPFTLPDLFPLLLRVRCCGLEVGLLGEKGWREGQVKKAMMETGQGTFHLGTPTSRDKGQG